MKELRSEQNSAAVPKTGGIIGDRLLRSVMMIDGRYLYYIHTAVHVGLDENLS